MNYQEDNKDKEIKKYKAKRRMLAIIIFLGIPAIIAVALSLANFSGTVRFSIIGMVPFIFPVMVIIMIPMIIKDMKREEKDSKEKENEQTMIE